LSVPGAGNSSIAVTYSAQDPHPVQGINYYRLKAVDFNGKYSYSAVILVRFGQLVGPIIYPNPARSYFAIVAGQDQIKAVSVYDVTGKVVKKVSNSSGASVLTVYCNDFAPGVYLIQISTTTQNYIRKLIRQ
jgi:hypothetical protein